MHQLMDELHGPGTSQRMHDAMGSDADDMLDQLATIRGMMEQVQATVVEGGMPGMQEDDRRPMQRMVATM
jgi:DNA-binding FrmR family transcriptional regulator